MAQPTPWLILALLFSACSGLPVGDVGPLRPLEPTHPTADPRESPEALVQEVIEAIAANQPERYVTLMDSFEVFEALCPELFDQMRQAGALTELRAELDARRGHVTEAISVCHDLIDWSHAVPIHPPINLTPRPVDACADLHEMGDIHLLYQADDRRVSVIIGDVYVRQEKTYGAFEVLACEHID